MRSPIKNLAWLCLGMACIGQAAAVQITVIDETGQGLATVMVTRLLAQKPALSLDDDGYPAHGVSNQAAVEVTAFSNAAHAPKGPSAAQRRINGIDRHH